MVDSKTNVDNFVDNFIDNNSQNLETMINTDVHILFIFRSQKLIIVDFVDIVDNFILDIYIILC